jgi:preprotein translocase subunit SecA
VDEVDSILIDEARTPLIISGQAEDHTPMYVAVNQLVPRLVRQEGEEDPRTGEGVTKPGDFTVDEKAHQVHLTERGHENAEALLSQAGLLPEGASLYDPSNIVLMHQLVTALKAHHLFHRDQHYVVQNGEIVIVDEFTGRLMAGRRWSDGLHQAVEAKEGVQIQPENQTLASITFQNYFRLYTKLGGMTGTADTEAYEFQEIYGLETVVIPPNRPSQRKDELDRVYKTTPEKYQAAIQDIRECHERGQPVLVGTSSIENSEIIAELLKKEKLPHEVLNAKQHAREADIIVQAGRPGAITIATNMAGRGTDIVLGGNLEKMILAIETDASLDEATKAKKVEDARAQWQADHEKVKALGGLRIIATERHESRRIDNQLRGRSGRQGDPGASRFYLSAEDDLIRLFAGDRIYNILDRLGPDEDQPIEHKMLSKTVENAQKKVEQQNFQMRKRVLEYDDVMNKQREVIYEQRTRILEGGDISQDVQEIIEDVLTKTVLEYTDRDAYPEDWDWDGLFASLKSLFGISFSKDDINVEDITQDELIERVVADARALYARKEEEFSSEHMRQLERLVMLGVIDNRWREHLYDMDYLREGIHWRGLSQKDPLVEYKSEGYNLFQELLASIKEDFTRTIFHMKRVPAEEVQERREENLKYTFNDGFTPSLPQVAQQTATAPQAPAAGVGGAANAQAATAVTQLKSTKVGRNDPCPCGSGKKYKKCCGA